jgi:hypothetical protein
MVISVKRKEEEEKRGKGKSLKVYGKVLMKFECLVTT